jgi:hypothetical protein
MSFFYHNFHQFENLKLVYQKCFLFRFIYYEKKNFSFLVALVFSNLEVNFVVFHDFPHYENFLGYQEYMKNFSFFENYCQYLN